MSSQLKVMVHVATISHRHGDNVYVAADEQGLWSQVAGYVRENLHEMQNPEDLNGIADPREIVQTYFQDAGVEGQEALVVHNPEAMAIPLVPGETLEALASRLSTEGPSSDPSPAP